MAVRPTTPAELQDALRSATGTFEIVGNGSKRNFGRPVDADQILSMAAFSGITIYEPEELILEAGAATPLAKIEAALAERQQQLAFEPPHYDGLMGHSQGGTIGGVLMCNLSGPRRVTAGAARDHVLRVEGVTGDGVAFKGGARVVKNVTGYDLPKLMAGSFGTLAALTSITFKVLPRAETEETLVVRGQDFVAAVQTMSAALQSPCEVSSAAHVPALGTCLRLEGVAASVAYRRDKLSTLIGRSADVLAMQDSQSLWASVRDVSALDAAADDVIWRLSIPPTDAPAALQRLAAPRVLLDWSGGLIWLAMPAEADAGAARVRSSLVSGHATLIRAPEVLRRQVSVFQPQAPALQALSDRVKKSFDARGILNPGRMMAGR